MNAALGESADRQDLASERSLASAFTRTARAHAARIALWAGGRRWRYDELAQLAAVHAARLAAAGVARGDRVGLHMERSAEAVVAMLAIARLGAAYVPFDPATPAARLQAQARAAGVAVLAVAADAAPPSWFAGTLHPVDATPQAADGAAQPPGDVQPDDLAYVMYTSGSTNEPKGVCIPQRAVLDMVHGARALGMLDGEAVCQCMSLAFDGATFEIWGALLTGARLVVAPPRATVAGLCALVEDEQVDVLLLSAGLFNTLGRGALARLARLRVLLAGGDVMSPLTAAAWFDAGGRRLVNVYGPTEVTTFSHCHVMTAAPGGQRVPIGTPAFGTTAYVVDAALRPVAPGEEGELCVGGSGLATGYLGNPALTAERFPPDPFASDGARIYRTGDLVRQRDDGALEFVGRIDTQVKIRGFRVELAEIETCLGRLAPLSAACVVHVRDETGGGALCAWCVAAEGAAPPEPQALVDALRASLPDYMVPRRLAFTTALPLTSNGKVDRRRLEAEAAVALRVAAPAAVPNDGAGDGDPLLDALRRLLGDPQLRAGDNFFDAGGDSLAAMRFCALVDEEHGVALPLAALFEAGTLGEVIARVRALKAEPAPSQPA